VVDVEPLNPQNLIPTKINDVTVTVLLCDDVTIYAICYKGMYIMIWSPEPVTTFTGIAQPLNLAVFGLDVSML